MLQNVPPGEQVRVVRGQGDIPAVGLVHGLQQAGIVLLTCRPGVLPHHNFIVILVGVGDAFHDGVGVDLAGQTALQLVALIAVLGLAERAKLTGSMPLLR